MEFVSRQVILSIAGFMLLVGLVAWFNNPSERSAAPTTQATVSAPTPTPETLPSDTLKSVDLRITAKSRDIWQPITGEAGKCEGAGLLEDFRVGQAVVLLGPDGTQLSADPVRMGRVVSTSAYSECLFEFKFTNVPEVATYRVSYPDGTVPTLTWSLQMMRDTGWRMAIKLSTD